MSAKLEKSDFLLLEPITVDFKYNVSSDRPLFRISEDIVISIKHKGLTKNFEGLSEEITSCPPERLPDNNSLSQTKYYEKTEVIMRSKDFFPESGDYEIQFSLHGVKSNVVSVNIKEPIGLDKAAYDSLNVHKNNIYFNWVWEEENGLDTLSLFVENYSQTVYGKFATLYLGKSLLAKDDLAKAKLQFEKLISVDNKYIADAAKKSLTEIEAKMKNLERGK